MTLNPQTSAVVTAATWLEGLLTGTLATSFAVLAIAGVGVGLLAGRIALRRAAQVVVGCFILFAAPVLVREVTGALRGNLVAAPGAPVDQTAPPAPRQPPLADPYAGAAVPME